MGSVRDVRMESPKDGGPFVSTVWLVCLCISLIIYLSAGLIFLMGQFMIRRDRSGRRPRVSVIVAARNEEANIAACLDSLVVQSYDDYEIIVVDDRSTDKTPELIKSQSTKFPHLKLVTIQETPAGWSPKKYALDRAIRASEGELLLFTDADCVVGRYWIETMISFFDDKTGLVIGFSKVDATGFFERFQQFDFLAMMTAAVGITNIGYPFAASGQNIGYRRVAFEAVGGFESVKTRISGDDVLLMHLIRGRTPWRVRFAQDPASYVVTRPVPGLFAFLQQRARWASNGLIMLKLSPLFFLYLSSVFVVQLCLTAGLWMSLWELSWIWAVGFTWMTKAVVDFAITYNGAKLFLVPYQTGMFVVWELLQIPYMLISGLLGMAGLFRWKR